jgi:hypothetical protein
MVLLLFGIVALFLGFYCGGLSNWNFVIFETRACNMC